MSDEKIARKSFEIVAGSDAELISVFALGELSGSFCSNMDEFRSEWPEEKGHKYKITISVERV